MGIKAKEEKEMKKQFAKLSKAEQEKVELEYHRMRPEEFEKAMSQAKRHTLTAVSRSKRKSKTTEKRRAA
jgi:hypothetical protein